jgi:DNA-directed RNA polymerase subunit RPC12/RpoP
MNSSYACSRCFKRFPFEEIFPASNEDSSNQYCGVRGQNSTIREFSRKFVVMLTLSLSLTNRSAEMLP